MPHRAELREQVGQMLLMGFEPAAMTGRLRATISSLQPGGIILFARNITAAQQTWDLLHECRSYLYTPPFTCVDLEGGTVDRLKAIIAPAPAAADVFATGNKKLFRRHGETVAAESRALGFNVDFAPVTDIGFAASKPILTSRTVSEDPQDVIDYAREFLKGMNAQRVIGCGKHYPGLGEANLDTHAELPSVDKPWKRLWNEDLLPYRKLHKQFPIVMVAHANYPAVEKNLPASLSKKWLIEILRKKIGFRGLVMVDDLEMGGVLAAGKIEDVALAAVRAGSDILPVCRDEENVWRVYQAVLHEAERDRKFTKLVAASAKRITDFKRRAKEMKSVEPRPTEKTVSKLKDMVERFTAEVEKARA